MIKFFKKWSLSLRWWTWFTLMNVGMTFMYLTGFLDTIYTIDFTKISFIIFGLCYVFTIRHGIQVYRACKSEFMSEEDITEFCQKNEPAWFASEAFLTLGMIGTVIGFIYTLSTSFVDIDPSNMMALKTALARMSVGMGTALYTTVVGLVCGIIVKIQLFDFQQYLDKIKDACGCGVKDEI